MALFEHLQDVIEGCLPVSVVVKIVVRGIFLGPRPVTVWRAHSGFETAANRAGHHTLHPHQAAQRVTNPSKFHSLHPMKMDRSIGQLTYRLIG